MHVGYTGSSTHVTPIQLYMLRFWLVRIQKRGTLSGLVFRHGDCIEGDEKSHEVAISLDARVYVHPPTNSKKRAFVKNYTGCEHPLPYLQRNQAIVDTSDLLIAMPDTEEEKLRSGTWSTIRYARRLKKPLIIIYPNGNCLKVNVPDDFRDAA